MILTLADYGVIRVFNGDYRESIGFGLFEIRGVSGSTITEAIRNGIVRINNYYELELTEEGKKHASARAPPELPETRIKAGQEVDD